MESPVQTKPEYPAAGWRFLVWWVVANTAAWGVGLGVPLVTGIALYNSLSVEVETGESASLLGFVAGICVIVTMFPIAISVGQWLVLRRYIAQAIWWIPATIVGIVGGVILLLILAGTLPGWAGLGVLIAIPQWLVLRWQLPGAGWWIPASLVSSIIWHVLFGEITGFFMVDVFIPFAAGSLVTGAVLLWLLRRRESPQIPQDSSEN